MPPKYTRRPYKKYTNKKVFKSRAKKGRFIAKLTKAVKAIALQAAETKCLHFYADNQQLYHNSLSYASTNMLSTTQGNTQQTRVGDEVIGKYLKIKLWLSNKLDRPNVMYRVILYTTPLSYTAINWGTGTSGNLMLSTTNSDKLKIIKQKLIRPFAGDYSLESGATNKEHSTYMAFNINLKNRKIRYQNDGTGTPLNQRDYIHLAIIAYDAYGSVITDNIASNAYQISFYYKDP